MTPEIFLHSIVRPGLHALGRHSTVQPSRAAERFLIAIALQESDATARYQNSPSTSPGPARGFWQFETAGVSGVLTHSSSSVHAKEACTYCNVLPQVNAVWRAVEGHDDLAVAIARLLILTEPRPLPETEADGWSQYLNLWRPGKPHPDRWPGCWRRADEVTSRDADPQTRTV